MRLARSCFALAVASAVGFVACRAKADNPRVELSDVGFTLHLPPPMQQALDSLAPGFRAVRATSFRSDVSQAAAAGSAGMPAAFAAVGDYDRDGTVDAVIEGTSPGDTALRVIAIRNGAHPIAIEVARFPVYDADAVGVYLTNPPAGTAGAFEVVNYPDSTLVFEFKDGAFTGHNGGS
ncbi:MAG: hypothetical protein ACJ79K_06740 [Gemmatimonadaceae bacterium]